MGKKEEPWSRQNTNDPSGCRSTDLGCNTASNATDAFVQKSKKDDCHNTSLGCDSATNASNAFAEKKSSDDCKNTSLGCDTATNASNAFIAKKDDANSNTSLESDTA